MDRRLKNAIGGLFRVDADLSAQKMGEGYGISNGLAWSADDRLLYHCDSSPARIYVYDFDVERGDIANRRIFAEFDAAKGRPDGCAADVEGFLWVAMPGSGRISRFDPKGRIERSIETPTHYPSSVAFGGTDLKTLYVTSLVPHELPPNDKANPEVDGAVFAVNVDTAGVPVARFGG
jgi:sugar lactone lactonase YvrE